MGLIEDLADRVNELETKNKILLPLIESLYAKDEAKKYHQTILTVIIVSDEDTKGYGHLVFPDGSETKLPLISKSENKLEDYILIGISTIRSALDMCYYKPDLMKNISIGLCSRTYQDKLILNILKGENTWIPSGIKNKVETFQEEYLTLLKNAGHYIFQKYLDSYNKELTEYSFGERQIKQQIKEE